jgi:transposase
VNFVWNYCNDAQKHTFETKWAWKDKWLSAEALEDLTAGSSKALDLPSPIVQKVCQQYVKSRKQHNKRWLRYRGRKSLGRVPFRNDQMFFDGKAFIFDGVHYEPMHLREGIFYPAYGMSGSFNQDAKGHWYINVTVEMRVANSVPNTKVGIDLGLETLAALSDGSPDNEVPRLADEHWITILSGGVLRGPHRCGSLGQHRHSRFDESPGFSAGRRRMTRKISIAQRGVRQSLSGSLAMV